jgi:hypothetical protein
MSHGGGGGFGGGSFHAGGHGGGHPGVAGHHGQHGTQPYPPTGSSSGAGWLPAWLPGSAETRPRGAALALIIIAWVLGVIAVAAVIAGIFVH